MFSDLEMLIGHKVPNLRLMGPNLHHLILCINFMVGFTVVFVRDERISILVVVSWISCDGDVP